jgi:glycerophosphoryl diester phosphodiesterase
MPGATLIIGHRGASRSAPENTLAAFRTAWEEGADGIEADFRLTGDGRIVCLHDASTGRTTGIDLAVAASSLAELRRLDVGRWKGPAWAGETIPLLAEVLASLPPGKQLFIELKSGPEMVAPLAQELLHSGITPEQVRLLAFSAPLLTAVKAQLPGYRCCWLTDYRRRVLSGAWSPSPDEVLATLRRSGADGLASRGRGILDERFVAALRRDGYEIHVWTVDSVAAASRFAALGVDSIMTNRPGWLRQRLAAGNPSRGGGASP